MEAGALTSRRDDLERRLGELNSIKQLVESEIFRKYFTDPADAEIAKLKAAFDCTDMNELKYTGGRHSGLSFFKEQLNKIDSEIGFIKEELSRM